MHFYRTLVQNHDNLKCQEEPTESNGNYFNLKKKKTQYNTLMTMTTTVREIKWSTAAVFSGGNRRIFCLLFSPCFSLDQPTTTTTRRG